MGLAACIFILRINCIITYKLPKTDWSHIVILIFQNYSSVISLHPEIIDGRPGTLVIESFVVDVPEGNTTDETCYFVEALIKCNLKSLADVSERLAVQDRTEPIDRLWKLELRSYS